MRAALTWSPVARTDGTAIMNQWSSGMNAQGDSNYILPCGAWASAGGNVIVRVTMGAAVDYFKPADGYDLCGTCQAAGRYLVV